jgi:hypothetical protein
MQAQAHQLSASCSPCGQGTIENSASGPRESPNPLVSLGRLA